MKEYITELFCLVDNFSSSMQKEMTRQQLPHENNRLPTRVCGIADGEIMTYVKPHLKMTHLEHKFTYYLRCSS